MPLSECPCGSGQYPEKLYDARGLFVSYICKECEVSVRAKYRPEIFEDSSYECDEPIDED
jgi:hypothetical protein